MFKIDLHCHTKATKTDEPMSRNVTKTTFLSTLEDAEVKIAAITNHNEFDIFQFIEFEEYCRDKVYIIPGVELDIKGDEGENGHVLLLCDPANKSDLNSQLQIYTNGIAADYVSLSTEQLLKLYQHLDKAIIIAHYMKSKELSQKTLDHISNIIPAYLFFKEPSSFKSLGILLGHGYRGIIGSDVQDWSKYPSEKIPQLKLEIDNYNQLILLSKKDCNVVDTLLNKKTSKTISVALPNGEIDTVKVYSDVNIVFGGKATGKSIYINGIGDGFISSGYKVEKYNPDKADENMNNYLKVDFTKNYINKFEGINDLSFSVFSGFADQQPTLITSYYNFLLHISDNTNRQKIRANFMLDLVEADSSIYVQLYNTYSKIKEFYDFFSINSFNNYITKQEHTTMITIIGKIKTASFTESKISYINFWSCKLVNNYIRSIKNATSQCTLTTQRPGHCGLRMFWLTRYKIFLTIFNIEKTMSLKSKEDFLPVGYLGSDKSLYTKTQFRFLCSKSEKEEYPRTLTKLIQIKSKMETVKKQIFSTDFPTQINELAELSIAVPNYVSVSSFIGVKKDFTLNKRDTYIPSSGESKMFMLMDCLNKTADVYVLDEPEKSMSSNFVIHDIFPLIQKIISSNKFVIMATHSANLAVLLLPYVSIYKKRDAMNGNYLSYLGNPFLDNMTNIKDAIDTVKYKETCMTELEGGRDAFLERGETYNVI